MTRTHPNGLPGSGSGFAECDTVNTWYPGMGGSRNKCSKVTLLTAPLKVWKQWAATWQRAYRVCLYKSASMCMGQIEGEWTDKNNYKFIFASILKWFKCLPMKTIIRCFKKKWVCWGFLCPGLGSIKINKSLPEKLILGHFRSLTECCISFPLPLYNKLQKLSNLTQYNFCWSEVWVQCICNLCSGVWVAKINVLIRATVLTWVWGSSSKLAGCWPNSFLWGHRAELLFFF